MVQMMLEAELPIDAVVCYNDQIAVEVIRMLERIGKKVPEDLSVTGYDDSMIARTGPVELTTVSHPQEKLGEMAAELLLELLHGIPPEESRVLRLIEPELVIRSLVWNDGERRIIENAGSRHPEFLGKRK